MKKKEEIVMKNNVIRLITIIMLVVMIVAAISGEIYVKANTGIDDITPKKLRDEAEDGTQTSEKILKVIQAILVVTQVIGIGVAVIMLIVLAIKYISASPGDKAEIKKHMVVYVVGAVLLFGAAGILEIIKRFAEIFN